MIGLAMLTIVFSNYAKAQEPSEVRDFGAYYTHLVSDEDWELFDPHCELNDWTLED